MCATDDDRSADIAGRMMDAAQGEKMLDVLCAAALVVGAILATQVPRRDRESRIVAALDLARAIAFTPSSVECIDGVEIN